LSLSSHKLIHYSDVKLEEIKSVEQISTPYYKPKGLWFSVEDGYGWREWCKQEEFFLENLTIQHELELNEYANILYLTSKEDLVDFSNTYKKNMIDIEFVSSYSIDWQSVAMKYQGIVIAPYQWDCRLESKCMWYYAWDCSSGCIWDASTDLLPGNWTS